MNINRLNYNITSIGAGPPLLLLHGFTGSSESWHDIANILSAQFRIIRVDLVGHGQTDSPTDVQRYTFEQTSADLAEMITQLGFEAVNLLGYSMGGRLALYFALHYPHLVQKLILESASPGLETEGERQERRNSDEQLAARIEQDGIEVFVAYWENLPIFATQEHLSVEQQTKIRAQRLNNHPRGLANSLRGAGTGAQPSLWPFLPQLHRPVLLMAGALDSKFVNIAERVKRAVPHAELAIVPNAGHTIHVEQPQIFCEEVANFVLRPHD